MRIDPATVATRLESVGAQLARLDEKLHAETAREALIGPRWSEELGYAADALRAGAQSLSSLGGSRQMLAGETLLADASMVEMLARNVRHAYLQLDTFGPRHADWTTRLDGPIHTVQAALEVLRTAPRA